MSLTKEEFFKQVKSLARRNKICLRGGKNDIKQWTGYSFEPYFFICLSVTCDDIWQGEETGNFLPQNCFYSIITKNAREKDTIENLWQEYHYSSNN